MANSEISNPGLAPAADAVDARSISMNSDDIWEQTFDAVSDPISVVDDHYRVVAANAAYKRMFGLPEGAISPHQCFEDSGGDHVCDGCPLSVTIEFRAPHMTRQERLVRVVDDDDTPRWERRIYQRWTYPIVSEDGSVHRVVEILRDVTEQDRIRELTTQAEALRRADQLKAELLGSVSHELRSPLTTIRGYAETLARHERRLTREERQEFLDAIIGASDRLGNVIERLLLLSRLETGEDVMEREPVDMGRLAQESLLAIPSGARARVSLEIAGSSAVESHSPPALALGDPRRLREAVDALIDNALKYTQNEGHVSIEVRDAGYAKSPNAGDQIGESALSADNLAGQRYIEVIVRDDGQGIPLESQPSIFDAFHRVETGLTRAVDGLGLGLAMCQRIVTLSHGQLWVESAPGAGSAFHMLLPAYEPDAFGN